MRIPTICACGEHAWADLTRGHVAIFDVLYAPFLGLWKWTANFDGRNWYAVRSEHHTIDGKRRSFTVRMHQAVMPLPYGWIHDHRNGDGLDNRKSNLRPATISNNNANQRPRKLTSSKYKGVSKAPGGWRSAISVDGTFHYLGLFADEASAAEAYDDAAVRLRGEFARTNFPANAKRAVA